MGIHGGFFGSDLGLVREREREREGGGERERSKSEREKREMKYYQNVFRWVLKCFRPS